MCKLITTWTQGSHVGIPRVKYTAAVGTTTSAPDLDRDQTYLILISDLAESKLCHGRTVHGGVKRKLVECRSSRECTTSRGGTVLPAETAPSGSFFIICNVSCHTYINNIIYTYRVFLPVCAETSRAWWFVSALTTSRVHPLILKSALWLISSLVM